MACLMKPLSPGGSRTRITCQFQGRLVGVISHVEALKDRILVQFQVRRWGNGASVVEVAA